MIYSSHSAETAFGAASRKTYVPRLICKNTEDAMLQDEAERIRLRVIALSRWDNEGGAVPGVLPAVADVSSTAVDDPDSADAEAVQLRIRVIALENLVIALLANAPQVQLDLAREMAAYISPRPGFTPHFLTLRAADEMRNLVDRAGQFRTCPAT
ncbi:hypothetical protein [Acidovorax sp.]|uniref:hypothetical protein n=1 Tax=Acidovorax sp. TaxID=1872122 RepID=UPI0027BA9D90|nr:hypothetical protein [Acidovorax sp.]